jgi:hypothetical protein
MKLLVEGTRSPSSMVSAPDRQRYRRRPRRPPQPPAAHFRRQQSPPRPRPGPRGSSIEPAFTDWRGSKPNGPAVWPLSDYLGRVQDPNDQGAAFGSELYTFAPANGQSGAVLDVPALGRVIFTRLQNQSRDQLVELVKYLDFETLLGVSPSPLRWSLQNELAATRWRGSLELTGPLVGVARSR